MADSSQDSGWWSGFTWLVAIIWSAAAALALSLAYPYGEKVFVSTLGVSIAPLFLIAFVRAIWRSSRSGFLTTVYVIVIVGITAFSGVNLHQGLFPETPLAAGSAASDARMDLWINLRDDSSETNDYRNSIRLHDGVPFTVSVGVQNLSYEASIRDATLELRAIPESGGVVRFIATVSAPGFPTLTESATAQSVLVSSASAGIAPSTAVTLVMKGAEGNRSIALDELDSLPRTWHLPTVPFRVAEDTLWVTLPLKFSAPGSVAPSADPETAS